MQSAKAIESAAMTVATEILDKALDLPNRERARIAEKLISSLDSVAESSLEVELAWQREVEKRLAQIDKGEVQCLPWGGARKRLRDKHCARR